MTSKERWQRIETILDELAELPPGERRPKLDELVGDDTGVREEVLSLLDAGERAGVLDGTLETFAEGVLDAEPPASAGEHRNIGPYRLLEELGHGGMGDVFLAERADG